MAQDGLHIIHVVHHLRFFLFNHSLLQSAAAGWFRRRADRSLLNLPVWPVLAQFFGRRLRISLQRDLRCFRPLILAESLLIFSSSLLRSRKLLLQFTILRNGGDTGDKRYSADNYQAPGRSEQTNC